MEQESNQMQSQPTLCKAGCGFFGNPGTEGMCSVCFKEALKKKQAPPMGSSSAGRTSPSVLFSQSSSASSSVNQSVISPVLTAQPTVPSIESSEESNPASPQLLPSISSSASIASAVSECPSETSSVASLDESGSSDGADKKKKSNRCTTCRKKVGLTGFECRCGGLYCSVHRYSDKHECTFNYREHGAEEIRRNNPVVVGQKIQKI